MPTQEHINGRRDFQARGVLSFGPFSLSLAERLLKKANDPVPLGGRALDTLIALTERAGEVVSYRELISIAWPNVTVDEANLRVQIATLRKALNDGEHGARYISNVAGRGYCFVAPVTRVTAPPPIAATGITDREAPRKLPPRLARMVGRDEAVRSVSEQLIMGRFVSIVGLSRAALSSRRAARAVKLRDSSRRLSQFRSSAERFVAILGPLCRRWNVSAFCAIDRPLLAVIKV